MSRFKFFFDVSITLGLIALLAFSFLPSYKESKARENFDFTEYLEVQSVKVHDAMQGEDPRMSVIRDLKQDFAGYYKVTIRKANGGEVVCSTNRVEINYRASDSNGNPTQLPIPTTLSWWAWGGSCTTKLGNGGLPPGDYVLATCHGILNPPGFEGPHEVCWPFSSVFTVHPKLKGKIHNE